MKKLFLLLFIPAALLAAGKTLSANKYYLINNDSINSSDSSMPVSYTASGKHLKLAQSAVILTDLLAGNKAGKAVLAYTRQMRAVDVYYFPGTSNKNALVIGGVHGSELSSVEVVKEVIEKLSGNEKAYYNVLVVPSLFPDNAAMAAEHPEEVGSLKNIGRYSSNSTADPNRQMPAFGNAFNEEQPLDFTGRKIEMENQLLLQLIQTFRPERIANIHAIRDVAEAGVYADPRTDCEGIAKGFATDSALALQMAKYIQHLNGNVPGNHLTAKLTALYHCDPPIAKEGKVQARNIHGSRLSGNRGYGVSLGGWASTAVCDKEQNNSRDAMILLTIEFPGNKRSADYMTLSDQLTCKRSIDAFASAITKVFLQQ